MATLEIHDGRNQVRRVRISRENPVMFGSDPMCDVVLDGPGVQPFHGRIRWKRERFKADASPEVPWIEVNGVQVKSKSIRQGDEIRVGKCRIFLLSVEDGPDHGEKTVVRDPPFTAEPPLARQGRPKAADFARMEMAPPSVESPEPRSNPEAPLKRSKYRTAPELDLDDRPAPRRSKKKTSLTGLLKKAGEQSAELKPAAGPETRCSRVERGSGRFSARWTARPAMTGSWARRW